MLFLDFGRRIKLFLVQLVRIVSEFRLVCDKCCFFTETVFCAPSQASVGWTQCVHCAQNATMTMVHNALLVLLLSWVNNGPLLD